jgi:glutamyl-tRNA synthetase
MKKVRVRFAPSPTGALHIGGVRTALFNYLFAKKNNGTFLLRIEDTDQTRFVPGAEEYIREALAWCGITPTESPWDGGPHAPYRQSERKEMYMQYALQLVNAGHAYYAFDTAEELDEMRERLKETKSVNQQYNAVTRMTMKNSLTLSEAEVKAKLAAGDPYVIRLKIPLKDEVRINDMIRGWVKVHSSTLDDKILMKSDGMPTYHLANVVDDHLMEITHVIRGEEWLPSAPTHALLYKFFGWEDTMPQFAHLPLILKPDGNGKLSKRAADQAGFPIFPLSWTDPESSETSIGFREEGYLPEALINFLAFLGWNPGTEQEIFSLEELVQVFSLEKVNKSGTKFDVDKIKWYNQQYIKTKPADDLAHYLATELKEKHGYACDTKKAESIVELLRERVTFPGEIVKAATIFFHPPKQFDEKVVSKKLTQEAADGLNLFANALLTKPYISAEDARELFSKTLADANINPGKVMQMLRVVISGEGGGPDLMGMIAIMGTMDVANRIRHSLETLKEQILPA